MLLYFSIVGGLFYKLFLRKPDERSKEITINPTTSTITKHKAADVNVG